MANRKPVAPSTQGEVLVRCRRRCCVCFGLARDESVKKGQVAHLDGDPSNGALDNLAFLCFDHHDELDSRTSQAKGLTRREVEVFRDELHAKFANWRVGPDREYLLNYLASTIDLDDMAWQAVRVANGAVWNGPDFAYRALTETEIRSIDGLIYVPFLAILDHFAAWGWLTFHDEPMEEHGVPGFKITIQHAAVCAEVAHRIQKRTDWMRDPEPS